MTPVELLAPLIASLNGCTAVLLVWAVTAVRRGNRDLHRTLMIVNLCVSALFVIAYLLQLGIVGHTRFPGDDWVRTLFLAILTSHTILAVCLVPLVLRSVYLAVKKRFPEHRRVARITFPIWLYISLTGVVVYWMNHQLRPPA
jgi:putative membrane protein